MTSRLLQSVALVSLLQFLPSASRAQSEKQPPDPLATLIASISRVASDSPGIGMDGQKLAEQIHSHGASAIPLLLPLLESPRRGVRDLTGYILSDQPGLADVQLDALIAARRRGVGWITPGIARIGTPRAIQSLIEDLRVRPERQGPLTFALAMLGERAAVGVADLLRDPTRSRELADSICEVFDEMQAKARPAVQPLLEIATNPGSNVNQRIDAVRALGCIGANASEAVGPLQGMVREPGGELSHAAKLAIMAIGTPEAAALFSTSLRNRPDVLALRDLARLRANGSGAGPVVVSLLGTDDWNIRVAAARTLGYIGYRDGAAALIEQLANESDWRIVYVSAESLGRLGVTEAIPALTHVAEVHWYPPVREAAKKALRVIGGDDAYRSRWARQNFSVEYFEYQFVGNHRDGSSASVSFAKGDGELGSDDFETLRYQYELKYRGVDGPGVERGTTSPQRGLSVSGGFLLGSNRGEWGGEFVFQTHDGVTTTILDSGTVGIHSMPFGIVAITPSGVGEGMLYLVDMAPNGLPTAHRWKALPSSPRTSGFRSDGSLGIRCGVGDVVLTLGGDLEMMR